MVLSVVEDAEDSSGLKLPGEMNNNEVKKSSDLYHWDDCSGLLL